MAGPSACSAQGIDVCYPKENKKLYEKVLARGAIISEFSTGTHPAPENFPIRNRIVAGMPLGVIVIEGAEFSGSLITAAGHGIWQGSLRRAGKRNSSGKLRSESADKTGRQAGDQRGRCHRRAPHAGACGPCAGRAPRGRAAKFAGLRGSRSLREKLYELLSIEQTSHIDELVENSGLNSSEVLATLFDLEMKGVIQQLPGKQFSKVML
jgi:DNA processing protein